MTTFDFSPLYRHAIGFDRLARLAEAARGAADEGAYPPYNIERTGDASYVLTMAVAGFSEADIDIEAREGTLTVVGRAADQTPGRVFLHRGIAGRPFERRFALADHIRVEGARLANGLLHVELRREVPEALKPRRISIQAGAQPLDAAAA